MLNQEFIESLASIYGEELAEAMIEPRQLPLVPEIQLLLLRDDYPKGRLGFEAYSKLMSAPPYWAFCWGGGQAMARYLLDHPDLVHDKDVVDFGAGSGIAGLAAGLAGAKKITAVDIDELALEAAKANAHLNELELSCVSNGLPNADLLVIAADICYEEKGMAWVQLHLELGGQLIVADSRVEQLSQQLPNVCQVHEIEVKTFPDLEEDCSFDRVKLYSTI